MTSVLIRTGHKICSDFDHFSRNCRCRRTVYAWWSYRFSVALHFPLVLYVFDRRNQNKHVRTIYRLRSRNCRGGRFSRLVTNRGGERNPYPPPVCTLLVALATPYQMGQTGYPVRGGPTNATRAARFIFPKEIDIKYIVVKT